MRPRCADALARPARLRPGRTLVDPLAVTLAAVVTLPQAHPVPVALAAVSAFLVCRAAGLHRSRLVLSVLDDLPALLLASVTGTLVLRASSASLGRADRPVGGLGDLVLCGVATFAGAVLLRTALHALTRALRRSGVIGHPVLIVGAGSIGRRLAATLLARREHGLLPVGMIDSDRRAGTRDLPLPLLGGTEDLDRVMGDLGVHDVIFAFPGEPDEETVRAVRRCVQRGGQVFVVPRFFELMGRDHHRRTEMVRDVAVTRLHRTTSSRSTRVLRRAVDVTVALGGLLVLSPVLLVLAVAVRLETGPGVVVQQTRVGEGGRTSTLLKFRSLPPATFGDDTTTWSIDNDSRIGAVGRFLRRTGLDDLPQLVDVLRGELSLVGPRPWGPALAWGPGGDPERYADRLRVPGGLTSWVRVDLRGDLARDDVARATAGPRHAPTTPGELGPTPAPATRARARRRRPAAHPGSPDPVLRLDDLTSEHWSWWVDLRIALGALRRAAARRRGARTPRLTAPDEPPAAAGRSATGHELPGLRRG